MCPGGFYWYVLQALYCVLKVFIGWLSWRLLLVCLGGFLLCPEGVSWRCYQCVLDIATYAVYHLLLLLSCLTCAWRGNIDFFTHGNYNYFVGVVGGGGGGITN